MQFGIRDILLGTTIIAVHLGLLEWQLGNWEDALPEKVSDCVVFLPTLVVLAYWFYCWLQSSPAVAAEEVAHYETRRIAWRTVAIVLVLSHLVIATAAQQRNTSQTAIHLAHQAIFLATIAAVFPKTVVIYESGVRCGMNYAGWDRVAACVGWEDGQWWLQASPHDASWDSYRVRLPEDDLSAICDFLNQKQRPKAPTSPRE